MKSPMVEKADYLSEKTGYSDLQVLRSGAGWYIGTIYTDPATGFQEPGSRDTDYFRTKIDAEVYLELMEAGGDLPVRLHP